MIKFNKIIQFFKQKPKEVKHDSYTPRRQNVIYPNTGSEAHIRKWLDDICEKHHGEKNDQTR